MQITSVPVNNTRVLSVTASGYPSSPTISRAWNITGMSEDFELTNSNDGNQIPFFIIPLSEGDVVVGLADDPGTPYKISSEEIKVFIGQPMLYLIKKVYVNGTTVGAFNIGI